jgi:hypothetical protein
MSLRMLAYTHSCFLDSEILWRGWEHKCGDRWLKSDMKPKDLDEMVMAAEWCERRSQYDSTLGIRYSTKMLIPKQGVFQGVVATVRQSFHTRLRGGLSHANDLCWSLRKRGRRNGAWPGNTKHAIRQRRVYVLDLDESSQRT